MAARRVAFRAKADSSRDHPTTTEHLQGVKVRRDLIELHIPFLT